mgnify:CR=1 FL=1
MANTPEPVAPQTRSRVPLIVGIVVAVLAVGVGAFLYLTRDTSEPELKLSETKTTSGTAVAANDLDGSWKVVAGTSPDETVAGYRVNEVFLAGSRKATANGRTNDVTGTLTVADGKVTEGEFTVDMTTLASDESQRDNQLRTRGLQTEQFPKATFEITEPITLPKITDGKAFEVSATGDLTLHGVTKPVTIELQARSSGDTFTVQGSAPVVMADFDIEPPSNAGMLEVEDHGSFEFIVNFQKG